ncbi:MAG: EAL domain-containing protein [Janthinobacterium lividum]
MAFQPIVDVEAERVFAYEALVRGPRGEGASSILSQVTNENRYAFDQSCRVQAITLASKLGLAQTGAKLSINFIPGAVYSPAACIKLTLATAQKVSFPLNSLIFEITEGEQVQNPRHLQAIADEYRHHGFQVALDDFGVGFANIGLLADLPVDVLKLDMTLTRDLHLRPRASRLVRSIVEFCNDLGTTVIAEGIETAAEFHEVRRCGIRLVQGYLLAKPAFEELPSVTFPCRTTPGNKKSSVAERLTNAFQPLPQIL